MNKHTPGPWFVESDTDTIRHGDQSQDGLNPNSSKVDVFGTDEGLANARLIAAAPELLAAAKFFAEFGGANSKKFADDPEVQKHLSAIAKAEGK